MSANYKQTILIPAQKILELKTQAYTVAAGDTMSDIASTYGVSLSELGTDNPDISDLGSISVGQVIRVPRTAPRPIIASVSYTAPIVSNVASNIQALMAAAGISASDFAYVDYIVRHESGWRANATEPTTYAYGLCQSLPASKMASAGADWQTNPVTQLRWCNAYAVGTYKGWANAYRFWISHRWW